MLRVATSLENSEMVFSLSALCLNPQDHRGGGGRRGPIQPGAAVAQQVPAIDCGVHALSTWRGQELDTAQYTRGLQPTATADVLQGLEVAQALFRKQPMLQTPLFWVLSNSQTPGKLHFKLLCYFQSSGNSVKERQTHIKAADRQSCRGPSA